MDDEQIVTAGDTKPVTEDDLRALKYDNEEVEPVKAEDETSESESDDESEEEAESDDDQIVETDEEEDNPSTFTKEFPNIKGDTPEEYARNLEIAYQNSTAEALRLKGIADAPSTIPNTAVVETLIDTSNPLSLYAQQKMDEEIFTAYDTFKKDYGQVEDETKYQQFTKGVASLSKAILDNEQRLASPEELYRKAAVMLGWEKTSEPDAKEKLGMAVKQNGAASKSSPTAKGVQRSKVSDEMISLNRKMYPGKTDSEIRKELEPYI
ncbi:hypothetical protein UFOVP1522_50 [uncultured Caudovirales phage]|uniref:Capsid assembly protein n=1 Tax=uncultured Caudovirales phage TaxID=2100421 RepID=A0A6J5QCP1_9CAUD|nr:hypothetical protein UFOVP989_37 [uncultured Caudovirales phage]CAB4181322.1 hypothetical protein UFOVP1075_29 [uncultured Caudovirales phage]CAB4198730.1 hypothetical protein UFOVP1312_21 [uncultured Caudovirales phage]CAB4210737.1 hypothetical protein UFOVP1426_37 [uncultured Caudovirales phage]CAB5227531.1 hypothetical protein UFOVP1522_50 [uncultured Caudovirales phage]